MKNELIVASYLDLCLANVRSNVYTKYHTRWFWRKCRKGFSPRSDGLHWIRTKSTHAISAFLLTYSWRASWSFIIVPLY